MNRLLQYLTRLLSGEYYKNIATLITGSSLSQLILIVLTPVLTRLFSPDDFGLYSLFLTIVAILGVIGTGRYEVALLLPKEEEEAQHLFQLSTALGLLFAILLFAIVPVVYPYLVATFDPAYGAIYYWIPFAVAFQVVLQTISVFANRIKKYRVLSISRIGGSGFNSIASMIYGYLQVKPLGLIYGKLFGIVLEVVILWSSLRKYISKPSQNWRKEWLGVMKKYQNFPKFSTFEALLNIGHKQLPTLALIAFFGLKVAGLYALANTLLSKPLGIVATSFSQVFYQQTAEEEQVHSEKLKPFFLRNLKLLFGLAILPALFVVFFGPIFFAFFLGEEWFDSGVFAAWLVPYLVLNFLKTAFSSLVDIKDKIRENAIWEGVFLVVGIFAFLLGKYYDDSLLTIQMYSISGSLLALLQLYWFYKLTEVKKQW
ncbi:MAG: oligosaccharide flippase family protein [Saprospiraceae bacterium]|nr:oligosaccharide flippase family protein [Saprospiraceae bacterium]